MTRETKELLLMQLLPDIRYEAAKFVRRVPIDRDDAEQEATWAAWNRLDHWDAALGMLWTFIRPRVIGAMQDYARRRSHPFGSTKYIHHKPLKSLGALLYHDGKQTTLGQVIPDYRETPQDRFDASDSFDDLTRNPLLRRIYFDDDLQMTIANEQGVSHAGISLKVKRAMEQVRAKVEGRK